jgi:flagellar motility protein MotE (MotC chaperone)
VVDEVEIEIAKIQQQLVAIEADNKWVKEQVIALTKTTTDLLVTRDAMKEQFLRHSKEHRENYKSLESEIASFKKSFSEFKGDVLKALDKAAGRDGVIKMFAMPAVTAAIVILINYLAR